MARPSRRTVVQRGGKVGASQRIRWMLPLTLGALVILLLGGWYAFGGRGGQNTSTGAPGAGAGAAERNHANVELPHLHGLGFSADGHQLIVPAHTGLRVFANGAWQSPAVSAHDYMGFVATDDGFYSSGHPVPGAGLINPFGLVKSMDGGKTLTKLGFEGESDFHLMGVGYRNHAIYVLNPAPNSKLAAGLHYSLDDGRTWQHPAMRGVTAQPIQIAVHPTQANTVALATAEGVFLSANHGDTFEPIGVAGPVTAICFSPDGARLFFGAQTLSVYDIGSKQSTRLQTPALAANDAMSYIAISPVQSDELAIATFGRNIYRSLDGGQSWQQIAQDGTGISAR